MPIIRIIPRIVAIKIIIMYITYYFYYFACSNLPKKLIVGITQWNHHYHYYYYYGPLWTILHEWSLSSSSCYPKYQHMISSVSSSSSSVFAHAFTACSTISQQQQRNRQQRNHHCIHMIPSNIQPLYYDDSSSLFRTNRIRIYTKSITMSHTDHTLNNNTMIPSSVSSLSSQIRTVSSLSRSMDPSTLQNESHNNTSPIRHTIMDDTYPDNTDNISMTTTSTTNINIQSDVHSITDDDDDNTTTLEYIQQLTNTWKDHPHCNPMISFPYWVCPNGSYIQSILQSTIIQPYLASQYIDITNHLRTRFKVVQQLHDVYQQQHNNSTEDESIHTKKQNYKIILLHPTTPSISQLPLHVQHILQVAGCYENDQIPYYTIQFTYDQFTTNYILNQILPKSIHPVPTAFETIGHVAHVNLKHHHIPYRYIIGQIIYETIPNIETVIQKIGIVSGPYRTYQYEILAGHTHHTNVQLIESGITLQFNIEHVYWCSRLSEERQRLLQNEILPSKHTTMNDVKRGSSSLSSSIPNHSNHHHNSDDTIIIADVFCGVGALCLRAAVSDPRIRIYANDWNPYATKALYNNFILNNIPLHQLSSISTKDAYEFLIDIGLLASSTTSSTGSDASTNTVSSDSSTIDTPTQTSQIDNTPRRRRRRKYHTVTRPTVSVSSSSSSSPTTAISNNINMPRLPDHVVMNFPLLAPEFLGALRWWPILIPSSSSSSNPNTKYTRFHVYTFVRDSTDTTTDTSYDDDDSNNNHDNNNINDNSIGVEEMAIDIIANNLLPLLPVSVTTIPSIHDDDTTKTKQPTHEMKTTNYDSTTSRRQQELNTIYGCHIKTHIVRDVAPNKVVVCVSFTVTPKLLRHMRGNFV